LAAITELARLYQQAPGTFREVVDRADENAAALSPDSLQIFAEVIQNADDAGANEVEINVGENTVKFRHDGSPVTLRDLHAMTIPWLTTKQSDDRATGRFGIGLKTLYALADCFEIHDRYYHVLVRGHHLEAVAAPAAENSDHTILILHLRDGAINPKDLTSWSERWSPQALMFLRSVHRITLTGAVEPARLALERRPSDSFELPVRGATVAVERELVSDASGNQWICNRAEFPSPPTARQGAKSVGEFSAIGVALPLFSVTKGCLYVGLPLANATDLPLLLNAQFDVLANRGGLLDGAWNVAIADNLATLWEESVCQLFSERPSDAWYSIPAATLANTSSGTLTALNRSIQESSKRLGQRLSLTVNGRLVQLANLAWEDDALTGVLLDSEIARIAGREHTLPNGARDQHGRWRQVLSTWSHLGLGLSAPVHVKDALGILETDTPIGRRIRLTALAIDEHLDADLERLAWVQDSGGRRHRPNTEDSLYLFVTDAAGLANALGMARILHDAYLADEISAKTTREWLAAREHFSTSNDNLRCLKRLAEFGEHRPVRPIPLTDAQVEALRDAVQTLGSEKDKLNGSAIGMAVTLDAFEFDARGERYSTKSRPGEAYLGKRLDRSDVAFYLAAAKTLGLKWISPRYSRVLSAGPPQRGDALGATKFLEFLGCRRFPPSAFPPLIEPKYYNNDSRLGLPQSFEGAPQRRQAALDSLGATHTLADSDRPDLHRVLRDIEADTEAASRRRRALDMMRLISRLMDRSPETLANVNAARGHYGWSIKGTVPPFWAWVASEISWVDDATGRPRRPADLHLQIPAVRVLGMSNTDVLHSDFDSAPHDSAVLLGIGAEPTARELVERLRELSRADNGYSTEDLGKVSSAIYVGLAHHLETEGELSDLSASELHQEFARSELIWSGRAWHRLDSVLLGPPVFGDIKAFAPESTDAGRLWRELGVRSPNILDCIEVIRTIARQGKKLPDGRIKVLIDTLTTLNSLVEKAQPDPQTRKALRQIPVWTAQGWVRQRPVYVTDDQQIAEGIGKHAAVWEAEADPGKFVALWELLNLTSVTPSDIAVLNASAATACAKTAAKFRDAVKLLQENFIRNSPEKLGALVDVSWQELSEFDVHLSQDLQLAVRLADGDPVTLPAKAWLDRRARILYLSQPDMLLRSEGAGAAVAGLFRTDERRQVRLEWLGAIEAAASGHEPMGLALTTPAGSSGSGGSNRDDLMALRDESERRRTRAASQEEGDRQAAPNRQGGKVREQREMRVLVNPSRLHLKETTGEIPPRPPASAVPPSRLSEGLKEPRPEDDSNKVAARASGSKDFTKKDVEELGLKLALKVLGQGLQEITDLRAQRGVGADWVDDRGRFWELKAHAGSEPDSVRLTRSEVLRAKDNPGYFLVVVSGLEGDDATPIVRIIKDPLTSLSPDDSAPVQLSGVRSAPSLSYRFANVKE
jgi:hypothetical protein